MSTSTRGSGMSCCREACFFTALLVEAWAGRDGCLRLPISQAVEIVPGFADMVVSPSSSFLLFRVT